MKFRDLLLKSRFLAPLALTFSTPRHNLVLFGTAMDGTRRAAGIGFAHNRPPPCRVTVEAVN
jgi:hypothetical protein